jgi:GPI mannosyltransferase 3
MFLLAAPASLVAVLQLGRLHPDEVYQSLEPAFTRVHGYGIVAWEWRPENAIRNWAVPLALAALLKLSDLLGIRDPQAYRAVLELPQLLLHAWALGAAYRFARRRLEGGPALLATALIALWGMTVAFAGRTLGESISASFLLVAFEALDREADDLRTGARGGLMLGLAVVARYGSLVFAAAGPAYLALCRRWRSFKGAVAAGAAVAVGLAALDWATWGVPLRSLFGYLRFNVLTGGASSFGTEPPTFYAWPLFALSPLWVWPGLWLASRRERFRLSAPAGAALLYIAAITATPHKESRFLYPAQLLLALAAAPAFVRWLMERARPLRAGLLAAAFGSGLGIYAVPPPDLADPRGDQFRAIVRAARDPAITGLIIIGEGVWGCGGYFYLGKRIPWTVADWPHDGNFQNAMRSPVINRAVTINGQCLAELQQSGFRVVGEEGRETILAR